MKADRRFLVLILGVLWLSLLLAFPTNTRRTEGSDTAAEEPNDVYQESGGGGGEEAPSGWLEDDEEEDAEEGYEKQYEEEEQDSKHEGTPSDSEEGPATEWPTDDEGLPVNPRDDDDMA